jgi:hypothetical protein
MDKLAPTTNQTELEVMPSFEFALELEETQHSRIAQHKAWLKSIRHERPLPKHPYKVAVYIRYFNQTKHTDYLENHKHNFEETLALCLNWEFVGFYIDEGQSAPNMETAPEWSRLLVDCSEGKVDLIITQKVSNISKKPVEVAFCARILATMQPPVGIYFISEDMFTLASYYLDDLKDTDFLPSPDWTPLPDVPSEERKALSDV